MLEDRRDQIIPKPIFSMQAMRLGPELTAFGLESGQLSRALCSASDSVSVDKTLKLRIF